MSTFTSSLPDDLLSQLSDQAKKLSIPKNKLLEKALRIYLDQLNRAEYVRSYRSLADDPEVLSIAEEGMEEYMKMLNDDETR